ncbi:hypothetical protein [Nocardioides marmoriginsengisoli]|uniref:hypothetical protein n=1 Tax=Nocardioides marmoriginsengisoli TaxID=661483 RepID=UPI0011CE30F1|nr:hypothetical protein [Nocardioides marmoriginsengisoli]
MRVIVVVAILLGGAGLWAYLASKSDVVRAGGVVAVVDGRHMLDRDLEGGIGAFAELTLIDGKCLGVVLSRGDKRRLVVWPHGSKLVKVGETVGIRVPDAGTFMLGDRMTFGAVATRDVSELDLPSACSDVDGMVIESPERP